MSRPRTQHGRRITIAAKFSEGEAAALDAARGTMSRSEWIRAAALSSVAETACRHPANRRIGTFCAACGIEV